jgi:hypothetical protein
VDPAKLMFLAPLISAEEDWRERSLVSWVILASHEGIEARRTDAGGKGFSGSWCGNVAVDGLVYRVHRAPRLRMSMLNDADQETWVLHSATYVEPVTHGVEVIDPRDDRPSSSERTVRRSGEVESNATPDLRTVELPEAAPRHETSQRSTGPEPGG